MSKLVPGKKLSKRPAAGEVFKKYEEIQQKYASVMARLDQILNFANNVADTSNRNVSALMGTTNALNIQMMACIHIMRAIYQKVDVEDGNSSRFDEIVSAAFAEVGRQIKEHEEAQAKAAEVPQDPEVPEPRVFGGDAKPDIAIPSTEEVKRLG